MKHIDTGVEYAYEGEQHIPAKNTMEFEFVRDNIKELEGKMLTLIEAVVDTDRQEATKDIVRDAFTTKYNWLWEYCYIVEPADIELTEQLQD